MTMSSFVIPRANGLPTIYANAMTEADIPGMAQALNIDKTIHNATIPIPWPYTETHARQFFEFCRDYPADELAKGSRHLVIRLAKDETPHVEWGIGYWLVPSCRGQGILPALVQEVKKAAQEDKRIARLEIKCFTDNPSSKRVAEKSGFTLQGTKRRAMIKHGKFKDAFVFSWIPREDQL
ncbi:acyl-CoA N-acyltransferase [Catenaria anguillulae PL171]|uniref:Acyl-CoA N-acyltransferase n=1 Tax=Catenaria anguillulae PL171 TaxID=765915 RepID=A0A1Y2HLZ2_9FUNG|nr:acyl-CoA N-acyltransferase [Catenaria anguillulae PL171]